jgi:hypothetical protein
MTRQKIFLSIPLVIAAGLLLYSWIIILSTDALATWRHYVGLALFLILTFFYFKSYKLAVVGTGIYFLLATFNVLSMTAKISTSWLRIGPVETPPVQLLSLGLFILFAILNIDTLIDIYLDYKEARQAKAKS